MFYLVPTECSLEHLPDANYVLDVFVIPWACTGVVGTYQSGASVHTLLLNHSVLRESGKSPKIQAMNIFLRYTS